MPEKVASSDKRLKMICGLMVLAVLVLVVRMAWVQIVDGKMWAEKAKEQLQETRAIQTPRGMILDRNGKEMAISHMAKSLYAKPREITDANALAEKLAPLLKMKVQTIKDRLSTKGDFIWLKRTLEPAEYQSVVELIAREKFRGLDFIEESRRVYPNDNLASHILGFVGTDDKGLSGLELAFDKTIKGRNLQQIVDTDSKGVPIFKSIFAFTKPKSGHTLVLTIDLAVQFAVEQALDKAMARTRAQGATAIIMNPKTGEILAMASRPGFNPNQFDKFKEQDWRNRAVSNIYEPGSTFKAIVAAASLQEKVVTASEVFEDRGGIDVGGRIIKNWDGGTYGKMPFSDVIKFSINTGFAQVAQRMGGQRMLAYSDAFGFGKLTGIELPGEEPGLLLNLKSAQPSDIATMGIGQAIAVTPLQLLTAVASLGNGGQVMKPFIIKEVRDSDGLLVTYTSAQMQKQAVSPEVSREMMLLLEKVITEGGGKKARVDGYRFAGKTGTAERLRDSGNGYDPGRYIASFVGVGPLEDPQLAAIVVIDSPSGLYYGGEIAAPVFAEIMSQAVRILGIRPSSGSPPMIGDKPDRPAATPPEKTPVNAPPSLTPPALKPGQVLMPNLLGKTIREASIMLENAGLNLAPSGTGIAVKQSIPANTPVNKGTQIPVQFEPR